MKQAIDLVPVKFTDHQLASLRNLRVLSEQIEALRFAVNVGQRYFKEKAPLQDVRDKFSDLTAGLKKAQRHIEKFGSGTTPAATEARRLLRMVSCREDGKVLGSVERELLVWLKWVEVARRRLPKTQTRQQGASLIIAVALIDYALAKGWAEARAQGRAKAAADNAFAGKSTTDPHQFRLGYQLSSPFREIVEICWCAMRGVDEANAERAIRGYVQRLRVAKRPDGTGAPPMQLEVRFVPADPSSEEGQFTVIVDDLTSR